VPAVVIQSRLFRFLVCRSGLVFGNDVLQKLSVRYRLPLRTEEPLNDVDLAYITFPRPLR
jgi:hypothetical protein